MKKVKSINQMIIDLIAPLTENSIYKVPSQREAWGSLPYFWESLFCLIILKRVIGEHFPKRKRRTDPVLIYQLGQPYLSSSKLLVCWNQLGGIHIKTRNGFRSLLGGTW